MFGDRKLFEQTVWLVPGYLGSGAGGARRHVVFYEGADVRPGVLLADQRQCAVMPKVSGEWVVVLVPQDSKLEVAGIGNVDAVIKPD